MSSRHLRMEQILKEAINPRFLQIEDESHQHSGPLSETHFKVLIVSEKFEGLSRVERQRLVNDLLKSEFSTGLHALTQRALTPQEWETQQGQGQFQSPACLGGGKKVIR